MRVSLIAAVADNGTIGRGGDLPWRLPADLRRFKQLTTGHHLIVGRRTWESVGRPLPGREFVVVTGREDLAEQGLKVARSVAEAIRIAIDAGDDEPMVAGGSAIYREALEQELVDRLYERGKALSIAEYFEIDDVIDPAETRRWITTLLESAPPRDPGAVARPNIDTW